MTQALIGNAASTRQQAKADKTLKQQSARQASDLSELLKLASFQRYVLRLLEWARHGQSTFSTDPGYMAYLTGKQFVGDEIVADLERVDPGVLGRLKQTAHADAEEAAQAVRTPAPEEDETDG